MPSSASRLALVGVTLAGLGACGKSGLDEKFVLHIDHGWSCGTNGYVGIDKHQRVRVEAELPQAENHLPDYVLGATLVVYTGKHLDDEDGTDPCDGRFDGEKAEVEFLYTATSGVATRAPVGPDLGITVDQLVLTPDPEGLGVQGDKRWEKLDDVTVDHYEFPAFGPG